MPENIKKDKRYNGLVLFLNDYGIKPINLSLYELAMTHSSWTNENHTQSKGFNNERLEFLGDAVLSLVVAESLYGLRPSAHEGELTFSRARAVCEGSLARIARDIGIARHLKLGKGEEKTGGRDRDSILADCFEALVGAIYLDLGYDFAKIFIRRLLNDELFESPGDAALKDGKSKLLEYVQNVYKEDSQVEYKITGTVGPPHARIFTSEVSVNGKSLGQGSGRTKQESEKKAAESALKYLEENPFQEVYDIEVK